MDGQLIVSIVFIVAVAVAMAVGKGPDPDRMSPEDRKHLEKLRAIEQARDTPPPKPFF